MSYRHDSEWNELNELRSLLIFKKLEIENFPRNKQIQYCREMSQVSDLEVGNISAKVSNYKSVAGVNKPSNASTNTIEIFEKYKNLSVAELEKIISNIEIGV